MATTSTSEYQGLSAAEYSKYYTYGLFIAFIIFSVIAIYTELNEQNMPYMFPIDISIVLASIYVMFTNKNIVIIIASVSITVITTIIIATLFMIQNMNSAYVFAKKNNIIAPIDYIINDQIIIAKPNYFIKNYWSSDALYAHIINFVYDQRTLSVNIHDAYNKSTNINVNINDYFDYDSMNNIIQKTYNN